MTMTVGSLFSGIEGIGLGLERAGMEVLWRCEVDDRCRELLEKRWPGVPVYDDVRTVDGRSVPRVDVLCGGFPCQDLSVAGGRAGLAGERSGLFHQFMRLVDEVRPTWVLIENVPGLLSSNSGRDMGVVLGVLADLGYGWSYRVLDAQYFGVAQRRRRVFIVGCLGDPARAAQVLLEPESCDGNPPPSRQARTRVAALTADGVGTCGGDDNQAQAGHLIVDPGVATAGCLNNGDHDGGFRTEPGEHLVAETFVPEVAHCLVNGQERQDGTVETYIVAGPQVASPLSTANGVHSNSGGRRQEDDVNLVAVGFAHQAGGDHTASGAYIEEGCPTLQVSQTMAVAYTVCLGSDPISTTDDLAQPVTGRNGDPGVVAYPLAKRGRKPAVAYPIQDGRGIEKAQNGLGIGEEGTAYTVDTTGAQAVAFSENQRGEVLETDYAHQLSGIGGKPGQGYPAIRQDMAVRRLTPLECERLQGFPDGWTAGFPDSTRYRMLGNAVCVPVATWIGRRMVAVS